MIFLFVFDGRALAQSQIAAGLACGMRAGHIRTVITGGVDRNSGVSSEESLPKITGIATKSAC
ncbi:MAG: hypothetical protein CFE31_09815 [Rhizobiales bacterium PAR1]|nr:MAG: hypothetical protein CFE31_09815 [Rhizobiales bacterium PAR1]